MWFGGEQRLALSTCLIHEEFRVQYLGCGIYLLKKLVFEMRRLNAIAETLSFAFCQVISSTDGVRVNGLNPSGTGFHLLY